MPSDFSGSVVYFTKTKNEVMKKQTDILGFHANNRRLTSVTKA